MTSGQVSDWHARDAADVAAALDTGPSGLGEEKAARRLRVEGPNRLPEEPPPSPLALLLRQFASPLIYLLLVAAAVTALLGEWVDAGVIAAAVALNTVIGFTQERRAEQSVRALRQLLAPKARVVRSGAVRELEGARLVPGDLVLLESGDRVPADLRLVSGTALTVDESLLTGESLPVSKRARPLPARTPLAERRNLLFAGTIVIRGRARGYVVATGVKTELGVIAASIRDEERSETPLQHRMTRFAQVITAVVVGSSLLAFGIGIAVGEPVEHMFLVAVALAVAAIPEGLPVVLTVTLALGVRRMARRHAIVRRLPAIETLGSTTVIGSDKTGTLTQNRMVVREARAGGRVFRFGPQAPEPGASPALRELLIAGVLANEVKPQRVGERLRATGDPTEVALLFAAERAGFRPEELRASHETLAHLPFESEQAFSARAVAGEGPGRLCVKGAPERVIAMCDRRLDDAGAVPLDRSRTLEEARGLAAAGLRVLALAGRELDGPPSEEQLAKPSGLTLYGLIGMYDPPREGVAEAIAGCRAAGIRVVMITGDHAETAASIARELGLAGGAVLTGDAVDGLDEAALRRRVRDVSVFARVTPAHKLRVVQALQANGEVVAVTGDGVNDAPALKATDIGIAMGRDGTDVAREAADMVLTDDAFPSIHAAVEEGRVTFDNIRKVTFFLVSSGLASILVILAAMALRWPLALLPAQLLWLNLVTKGLQDMALAFEPGEPGVLARPPRPREEGIVTPLLWERTAVVAAVMAVGALWLFSWSLDSSGSVVQARSVTLTGLVLMASLHVGNARSERTSVFRVPLLSNPFLFLTTVGAVLLQIAALHYGPLQYVLRVEPLGPGAWLRIGLASVAVILAVELHKLFRRDAPPHRGRRRPRVSAPVPREA